jgi:SAM-dependent methyltransferase
MTTPRDTLKQVTRNLARHGIALARELAGAEPRYDIRGAYRHRTEYSYFDDTHYTDEYQKEVYVRAAELAASSGAQTVYDVGCGSGYKLVHYLGRYETTGFDVPQTLEYLQRTYPDRNWEYSPFSDLSHPPADVTICSDVIEHVLDPDELMRFLVSLTKQWLVLSTPDRNRAYPPLSPYRLGPPPSDHHVREWAFSEFRSYVARFMDVVEHRHTHPDHSTQMIVARCRRKSP